MLIGSVTLALHRTGSHAKLALKATPFSHEVSITCDELDCFIRELTDAAMDWRRERHMIMVDYYIILGVSRLASADEIQQAYRARAKRYHPDTSSGETAAAMAQLNSAYETLSDPVKKQQYDGTFI